MGIMIQFYNNIYWFNGKRYEFWCKTRTAVDIFYFKLNLYCYYNLGDYGIFKNKTFIKYRNDFKNVQFNQFAEWHSNRFVVLDSGGMLRYDFTIEYFDGIIWKEISHMTSLIEGFKFCYNWVYGPFGDNAAQWLKNIPKDVRRYKLFKTIFYFFNDKKCVGYLDVTTESFFELDDSKGSPFANWSI